MNDEVTICLVRHGETAWNAVRRIQGQLDIPLNDTGRAQAEATAAALASHRFDALYCSDLERARTTAAPIASRLGLPAIADSELRERHYGNFQGFTYEEAAQRFPDDYAKVMARDPQHVLPDGGESLAGLAARIAAALDRIADANAGAHVLIVTHGGVLDVVNRLATGKTLDVPRDFIVPNAALNWIARRDGRWRLISWAEQGHLPYGRDESPRL